MKPIINPVWFYLINMFGSLKDLLLVLMIVIIVVSLIGGIFVLVDENFDLLKKYFGKLVAIIVIGSTLYIAIPDKSTCYQMMIASQVTPNNIEIVQGEVKNLVDYIIEAADKLNDKEEDGSNSDK